jgi:ornithine cyclodeaminase/alanine dehydrogenase-like protein (mu-crystallin family)
MALILSRADVGHCLNMADEVTFFKSVGIAVQDVAVALHVCNRARELGIGIEVDI